MKNTGSIHRKNMRSNTVLENRCETVKIINKHFGHLFSQKQSIGALKTFETGCRVLSFEIAVQTIALKLATCHSCENCDNTFLQIRVTRIVFTALSYECRTFENAKGKSQLHLTPGSKDWLKDRWNEFGNKTMARKNTKTGSVQQKGTREDKTCKINRKH